jgi:hypothetical protein
VGEEVAIGPILQRGRAGRIASTPTGEGREERAAELLAQGPQLLSSLRIVGLPVGASLQLPFIVATRDPFQIRRDDEADGRVGALLYGAHRVAEGLEDHLVLFP